MKETSPKTVYYNTDNKILYLHLRYNGDTLNELTIMKLNNALRGTSDSTQIGEKRTA